LLFKTAATLHDTISGLRVLTVGFEFHKPNMPAPARQFRSAHNLGHSIFQTRPLGSETGQYPPPHTNWERMSLGLFLGLSVRYQGSRSTLIPLRSRCGDSARKGAECRKRQQIQYIYAAMEWRARRTSKFSIIVLIMKEVLPGLHWEGQIGGQIVP
jgi:hypothetical protein